MPLRRSSPFRYCCLGADKHHEGGFYLHDAVQPRYGGARDAVTRQRAVVLWLLPAPGVSLFVQIDQCGGLRREERQSTQVLYSGPLCAVLLPLGNQNCGVLQSGAFKRSEK